MEKSMTYDEAKHSYEFVSKNLKLRFRSYYKYEFWFFGKIDNIELSVTYGGDTDSIYRYEVDIKPFDAPILLEELIQNYNNVQIKDTKTDRSYSISS